MTNAQRVTLRAALEALAAANDQRPVGSLSYVQAFQKGTHAQLCDWLNAPEESGKVAFPAASTAQELLAATTLVDLDLLTPARREFWFAALQIAPLNLNQATVRAKLLELWGVGPGVTLAKQLTRPASRAEVMLADSTLALGSQTVVLGFTGPITVTEMSEALLGKAPK